MIEYVFFILLIGPFLVKYLQAFYFLQLHDYQLSGIREAFWEKIFKKVFFQFWIYIEIPFFILGIFFYFFDMNAFEFIFTDLLFYYLMIANVFVLWKLFRGRTLKPRFDFQTLIGYMCISLIVLIGYISIALFGSKWFLYLWILFFLSVPYLIIDGFYRGFLYRKRKTLLTK